MGPVVTGMISYLSGSWRVHAQVSKAMSTKKILKRSKIKPFLKFVNFNHVMPTRYSVDIDVKSIVQPTALKKEESRVDARKEVKKLFENRCVVLCGQGLLLGVRDADCVWCATSTPACVISKTTRSARTDELSWRSYLERGKNSSGVQYFFQKLRF